MRRWIAWTITLLASSLCFFPGIRTLWSGPWGTGQMIQPGTAISVRLLWPITSASAKPGQPFAGYVVSSEAVKGSAFVRPGTLVEGTCLAVRRARRTEDCSARFCDEGRPATARHYAARLHSFLTIYALESILVGYY
jgi:hypothetical protein